VHIDQRRSGQAQQSFNRVHVGGGARFDIPGVADAFADRQAEVDVDRQGLLGAGDHVRPGRAFEAIDDDLSALHQGFQVMRVIDSQIHGFSNRRMNQQ